MQEDDPKVTARKELASRECQDQLRQFVNTDGPKGSTPAYKEGWERIFGREKRCQAAYLEYRCDLDKDHDGAHRHTPSGRDDAVPAEVVWRENE